MVEAYQRLFTLFSNEEYFSKKSFNEWESKWNILVDTTKLHAKYRKRICVDVSQQLDFLHEAFQNPEDFLNRRNQLFMQKELDSHREYFDTFEKYPLTQKQREAIIIDEYRNLVVAGAGTGKTSVLIGKAGYLLRKRRVKPEEILLLSFGKTPNKEMIHRLQNRLGLSLDVKTFHGLGMGILAEVYAEKPSVSNMSTDPMKLQQFIKKVLTIKEKDERFLRNLNKFFLPETRCHSLWEFKTREEYVLHLRNNNIRSLKGDLVESYEELEIANFLYTNGVNYVYAAKYEHPTASELYHQYEPDFYLPNYGIYIEHFGIDRKGNTASGIDRNEYQEGIKWKREIHKKFGTKLIETFSYERTEGQLLQKLKDKLEKQEIKLTPISEEQLFKQLNKQGYVRPIEGLIATFLNHYKSSNTSIDAIKEKANSEKSPERVKAFLEIFRDVYQEYENQLTGSHEIDFNDMINKTTEYIITDKKRINYTYILVDEFQDISQSRYQLLNAILDQNPECKLFCVGDDWQSIFRFNDSDINIMTHFKDYFDESATIFLKDTFRFNNQISDFSTKFISKNPNQIQKELRTKVLINEPAVSVYQTEDTNQILDQILTKLNNDGGTVFILGRYNKPNSIISTSYPNLQIQSLTVHKSKGTEADYVILPDLNSGTLGFPCEISDDPILNIVLSKQESYPHAEERRLFYVAISRAKKHVYLISGNNTPSVFFNEILNDGYNVNINEIERTN